MHIRIFFNGKFRHYEKPEDIYSDMTPDEIRASNIDVVVGGEVVGTMEPDRLALSAESLIVAEKIKAALEVDGDVVHKGFTRDALERAFDMVTDPDDWKAEINATIPAFDLGVTVAAIEFFTATEVDVKPDVERGLVEIHSVGYRRGPAGP